MLILHLFYGIKHIVPVFIFKTCFDLSLCCIVLVFLNRNDDGTLSLCSPYEIQTNFLRKILYYFCYVAIMKMKQVANIS